MQKSDFFKCVKKLHFIGIFGVSMSALAKFSAIKGKIVTGSDQNIASSDLEKYGITVYDRHRPENVWGADAVIYTSAVKEDNVELVEAKKRGIPLIRRGQFLGMVLNEYKNVIAVSGSHGKTTTTAMISNALIKANRSPACFIGGEDLSLGNFVYGEKDDAVCEACEYQKNFLDIFPSIAVVLNIDNDHLDCYGSIENEIVTFSDFIKNTIAVINADDKNCRALFQGATISFGITSPACYTAFNLKKGEDGCYSFSVRAYSIYRGRINLKVCGKHNVYNALATIAVLECLGVKFKEIKRALENFKGVKRRGEMVGKIFDITAVCDYAHHPSEIRESIKTFAGENTLIVFQPHTYSRTKLLIDEFVDSLTFSKNLIIYKTYPAREPFDKDGSSYSLYRNLQDKTKVFHANCEQGLLDAIKNIKGNIDKILFLGAGDIYWVAKKLCKNS